MEIMSKNVFAYTYHELGTGDLWKVGERARIYIVTTYVINPKSQKYNIFYCANFYKRVVTFSANQLHYTETVRNFAT